MFSIDNVPKLIKPESIALKLSLAKAIPPSTVSVTWKLHYDQPPPGTKALAFMLRLLGDFVSSDCVGGFWDTAGLGGGATVRMGAGRQAEATGATGNIAAPGRGGNASGAEEGCRKRHPLVLQ